LAQRSGGKPRRRQAETGDETVTQPVHSGTVSKVTRSRLLEAKGRAQELVGQFQKAVGKSQKSRGQ